MKETFTEKRVTYTLSCNGQFFIIENVPARVCNQTGEEFFQPETVEHLQQLVKGTTVPKKTVQTPVFEYS